MKQSKPRAITILISVILFVVGLIAQFAMGGTLLIPAFVWVVAGYVVLLLGNLLSGI
ncbi:MAG TPA: hypothetical protein VLR89_05780 [Anaerolineaceae bacterium]|nr:hypothetical protein [Anaerolineaceae bacterium]